MSIKKSLAGLVVAALASMAFASMALAAGGTVREVNSPFTPMAAGELVHYVGWAKFSCGVCGSFECHVTAITNATSDVNANVVSFTVPDTNLCTGTGVLGPCTLTSHNLDNSTPTVTATATDFDVQNLKVSNTYSGCSTTNATLTFPSITLKPLATGSKTVTGTNNKLGATVEAGKEIAGVEISGAGTAKTEQHIIFVPTPKESEVTASGELEVTSGTSAGDDRCTWKLVTF